MTLATTGGNGTVEAYEPSDFEDSGLEDVGSSDVIIPRLRIVHDSGVFQNNLTKETFEKLTVILLGLVKQRIMWDKDVDEGDAPQCKSPDFDHGFPQMRTDIPKDKQFRWATSNFSRDDARPIEIAPGESRAYPGGYSSNGHPAFNCASCIFKEWNQGDWKVPPCSEQHTYPLLYQSSEDADWMPALLTVQKTGIKPSRTYISNFAASKTPMFTVYTELGLVLNTRGMVKYSVPTFKRLGSTDRNLWRGFAEQQRSIRSFVRQAPRRSDEEEPDESFAEPSANVNTPPPAAEAKASPAPAPAAKAPEPAAAPPEPEATEDDGDDLPF